MTIIDWSITQPQTYIYLGQSGVQKRRSNCISQFTVTSYDGPQMAYKKKQYVRTGQTNTEFKWLKSHGQLVPPLSATLVKSEFTHSMGVHMGRSFLRPPGCLTTESSYTSLPSQPTIPGLVLTGQDAAYNQAYKSLMAKMRYERTRMLAIMAEAHETSKQLGSISDSIASRFAASAEDFSKKLSKAPFRRMKSSRLLKVAADYWLGWSFGIKPLLGDVHDVAEALAEIAIHRDSWRRVNGFGVNVQSDIVTGSVGFAAPPGFSGSMAGTSEKVTKYTVVRKIGGTMAPYFDIPYQLYVAGLTPDRVLPAVWELVPYSWLVDYFANVGDMIDALCSQRIDLAIPWEVYYSEASSETKTRVTGGTFTDLNQGTGWTTTAQNVSFSRGPTIHFPLPSFYFRPYSRLTQYVNSLAAGIQVVGRDTVTAIRYSKKADVVRFINHWR